MVSGVVMVMVSNFNIMENIRFILNKTIKSIFKKNGQKLGMSHNYMVISKFMVINREINQIKNRSYGKC